jgi:hypothetical protein
LDLSQTNLVGSRIDLDGVDEDADVVAADLIKNNNQGDQIFACWVIITSGSFFKLHKKLTLHIGLTSYNGTSLFIYFDKNGLGHVLGDFFINASGHLA